MLPIGKAVLEAARKLVRSGMPVKMALSKAKKSVPGGTGLPPGDEKEIEKVLAHQTRG